MTPESHDIQSWEYVKDLIIEQQFAYIKCVGQPNDRFFYFSSWSSAGGAHDCIHCGVLDGGGNWGRGISTGRVFKADEWYFISGVVDTKSGFIKVYSNGELVQQATIATGDVPGDPAEIWIGGAPEAGRAITGIIDDVVMFNTALTDQDIVSIMNNGVKSASVQAQNKLPITWAVVKLR